MGKTYLNEGEMRKCIIQLLKTVHGLHSNSVRHGRINLDTIYATRRSKGLELKLGGFELSELLSKEAVITEENILV